MTSLEDNTDALLMVLVTILMLVVMLMAWPLGDFPERLC